MTLNPIPAMARPIETTSSTACQADTGQKSATAYDPRSHANSVAVLSHIATPPWRERPVVSKYASTRRFKSAWKGLFAENRCFDAFAVTVSFLDDLAQHASRLAQHTCRPSLRGHVRGTPRPTSALEDLLVRWSGGRAPHPDPAGLPHSMRRVRPIREQCDGRTVAPALIVPARTFVQALADGAIFRRH